jgi:uncharacterized protein (TIGR02001 family)
MQKKLLVAALGALFALPALAEDAPAAAAAAPAAAPAPVFTSNVGFVSNYIFRGVSQTGGKPTIQGGFDYTPASGFYAGVWGSGISWISDGGAATSAGTELDTYFGFRNTFATDFNYDVGFLRYNYPGNYGANTSADTNEIYGLIGYKWISVKYSDSLGDTFGVSNASGSGYIDVSASYALGDSGYTVGAHYGKQTYKGSTADALRAKPGISQNPDYTDYKLSITKDISSLAKDLSGTTIGLTYTNTNNVSGGFNTNPQGKDLGKGVAVLSVNRTF